MPNGDIVSGSSDGVVRVFSESESRWALPEVLKQYEETLASQALPSQQVGDLNKEQVPNTEALSVPGTIELSEPRSNILIVFFKVRKMEKLRWSETGRLLKLTRCV